MLFERLLHLCVGSICLLLTLPVLWQYVYCGKTIRKYLFKNMWYCIVFNPSPCQPQSRSVDSQNVGRWYATFTNNILTIFLFGILQFHCNFCFMIFCHRALFRYHTRLSPMRRLDAEAECSLNGLRQQTGFASVYFQCARALPQLSCCLFYLLQ